MYHIPIIYNVIIFRSVDKINIDRYRCKLIYKCIKDEILLFPASWLDLEDTMYNFPKGESKKHFYSYLQYK